MTAKTLLQSAGDGTAVPSGFLMSTPKTASGSFSYSAANGWKDTGATITLEPGMWIVKVRVFREPGSTVNIISAGICTTSGHNATGINVEAYPSGATYATTALSNYQRYSETAAVPVTSTTTYYLKTFLEDNDTVAVYVSVQATLVG